jgi:hypothetical protein
MRTTSASTRRSFIWTAGAAVSAPLAAAAATVPPSAFEDDAALAARLSRLEDMNSIRALNQAYARLFNAGAREELVSLFADPSEAHTDPGLRAVTAVDFGDHDVIDVAADGNTAVAVLHCTAEAESDIGPSCPLVEMARQQGGGIVRRTERGVFENLYVKHEGFWKIQRSRYRPA